MPDLVALALPGGPAFVEAFLRTWDRGDAVLPVDLRLPAPARAALLAALGPTVLVDTDGEHRRREGIPAEPGDALVVATSGTTGAARGVVLTHDVAQRDNLRVGRHDGVVAVVEKLKGHPLFAHVTLNRSERSPIAALVTEMLEDVAV
jgi:acyl-coenzyme A synthetase/AMP-(fatty) acid ligase